MNVEILFREHYEELFRYASLYSGDPDFAKDVVQDTFIRLQERPPRHDSNVRSWLYRVATNLMRDHRRVDARRRDLLSEYAGGTSAGPDPLDVAEREEARVLTRRALGILREKERTALLMRAQGFAHREIAETLGTTTGSIGTLIARSLEKLAVALPDALEVPE